MTYNSLIFDLRGPLNYGSSPILLEKRDKGFQGSRIPGFRGQGSGARVFIFSFSCRKPFVFPLL